MIKVDLGPVIAVVAIRTLPGIMIVAIQWYVARFAIDIPVVVKGDIGPVVNIVTVGTLSVIVI